MTSRRQKNVRKRYIKAMDSLHEALAAPITIYYRTGNRIECDTCIWDPVNNETLDPNCPECFMEDTNILTLDGFKKIQDISIGDLVFDGDGYNKVSRIYKRLYFDNLLEIKVSRIGDKIYCTKDHPFLGIKGIFKNTNYGKNHIKEKNKLLETIKSKELDIIKAKDLDESCAVFIPIPELKFPNNNKQISIDMGKWNRSKLIQYDIDHDLAYIFGWYISEGNTGGDINGKFRRTIYYALHEKEYHIAQKIVGIFKEKFDINGKIRYKKDSKCIIVEINNAPLARFFHKTFGHKCYNKHIPKFMYTKASKDVFDTIVYSILNGDGHFRKNRKTWELGQTSELLNHQLFYYFLQKDDIKTYYRIQEKNNNNGYNHNKSWHLSINEIKKTFDRKIIKYKNGILVPITKINIIDNTNSTYVYNLEVENTHKYCANGVLVHNCNGNHYLDEILTSIVNCNVSWVGASNAFTPLVLPGGTIDRTDVYMSFKLKDVLLDQTNQAGNTILDQMIKADINGQIVVPKTSPFKYAPAGILYNCFIICTLDKAATEAANN